VGIERNATVLLAMLDDLGIERATFVAHSWAGAVALWLAEAHPERVEALVLAASVGPHAVTRADRILAVRLLGEALAWSGSKMLGRVLISERGRAAVATRLGDGATEILRSGLSGRAWHAFTVEQRSMVRELPHIIRRLEAITAPTTVVTGDRDRVVQPSTASALVHRISSARLVTIPYAGHALPVEAPDALAAAIASAIREAASGRRMA
jgi:pimeloyl-ACP methyl ester carboxylesterase